MPAPEHDGDRAAWSTGTYQFDGRETHLAPPDRRATRERCGCGTTASAPSLAEDTGVNARGRFRKEKGLESNEALTERTTKRVHRKEIRGPHKIPHTEDTEIASTTCKRLKLLGGRGRNRTYNLSVKSRMLCQLSYASRQLEKP
jgi:hypothetical protein